MLLACFLIAGSSFAQSIDPNTPSPVRGNSVNGRIAARDLGDARLTDHYYAFTGTPGDRSTSNADGLPPVRPPAPADERRSILDLFRN